MNKSIRMFTQEHPPKSGKAKKLWDWFAKNNEPILYLYINRPGFWQRGWGVPNYFIESQNHDNYCVWDVNKTLSKPFPNRNDPNFVSSRLMGIILD